MTDENDVALQELKLEEKSIEHSNQFANDLLKELSPKFKFIIIYLEKLLFVLICFLIVFALVKYQNKINTIDNHYTGLIVLLLLLPILTFATFIPERYLLHKVFNALIELVISLIKLPMNISQKIYDKIIK
jgi:heme A synthase